MSIFVRNKKMVLIQAVRLPASVTGRNFGFRLEEVIYSNFYLLSCLNCFPLKKVLRVTVLGREEVRGHKIGAVVWVRLKFDGIHFSKILLRVSGSARPGFIIRTYLPELPGFASQNFRGFVAAVPNNIQIDRESIRNKLLEDSP